MQTVPAGSNIYKALQYIRPFTVGRKNWVNVDSIRGAEVSAIMYSLMETAKANGLRVYDYLEYVLTELAAHQDDTDRAFLADLLPWSKVVQKKCRIVKKNNLTIKDQIYGNRQ